MFRGYMCTGNHYWYIFCSFVSTLSTMRIRYLLYGLCLFAFPQGSLWAQTLPVGSPLLEDYYRRLQLLGEVDSSISFSMRPLTADALGQTNVFDPEGVLGERSYLYYFPDGDGQSTRLHSSH